MNNNLTYTITIGGIHISDQTNQSDRLMSSLFCEHGMDCTGGTCKIALADIDNSVPQCGEEVMVKIDNGEGEKQIFTGEVESSEVSSSIQCITASDSAAKLARYDLQSAYEKVGVEVIIQDILDQAGVTSGTIEKGPEFPSYVLLYGPRALHHVKKLACMCGFDVFTDGMGNVHVCGPLTKAGEYTFEYGVSVKECQLKEILPVYDGMEIFGEGAAGSKGAEKYYWLTEDLTGVSGKAALDSQGKVSSGKSGQQTRYLLSGAARSQESAEKLATGTMTAISAKKIRGYIKVPGAPGIFPGDVIKIDSVPKSHPLAEYLSASEGLRARRIRHWLNTDTGFITRMDF